LRARCYPESADAEGLEVQGGSLIVRQVPRWRYLRLGRLPICLAVNGRASSNDRKNHGGNESEKGWVYAPRNVLCDLVRVPIDR